MAKPLDLAIFVNHSSKEFAITVRDMKLNTHFKKSVTSDQFFDPRWPERRFTVMFEQIDSNLTNYLKNALDILYKANGYTRTTVKGK